MEVIQFVDSGKGANISRYHIGMRGLDPKSALSVFVFLHFCAVNLI